MKNILLQSITASLLILSIPFIGMKFTSEANWDLTDFIIMGILVFSISMLFNFAMKKIKNVKKRVIAAAIILGLFFYIWAELAVGIFTNLGS